MLLKDLKYKVWTVVCVLLIGLIAIVAFNQAVDVKHIARLKEVSGKLFSVAQKSQEMVSNFKLQVDCYEDSFLYGDLDLLSNSKEYKKSIEDAFDNIFLVDSCSQGEIEYLNKFFDRYIQYCVEADYIYGMLATDDPEQIKKAEAKTAYLYNMQKDISDDLYRLDEKMKQNLRDEINSINLSIKNTNSIVLVFSVLIILAAVLINGFIINYSIFRPVDRMFNKLNIFEKEKDVEMQLLQRHRLESLGDLAGGVAHEINNPVSCVYNNMKVMANYTEMIKEIINVAEQMPDSDPDKLQQLLVSLKSLDERDDFDFVMNDVGRLLEESTKETERISEIVANLLFFARPDATEAVPYNIVDGLKATIRSLKGEIENKGRLFEDYQLVSKIICYPGDINLAFMSVIKNALQAIDQGGSVYVSVKEEGANVIVEIKDDGCGIAESELNNIFNLFYTTRPFGQGMGLGLSVAYGIIRSHDGYMKVESTLHQGSVFTIVLPIKTHLSRKFYNKDNLVLEKNDVG